MASLSPYLGNALLGGQPREGAFVPTGSPPANALQPGSGPMPSPQEERQSIPAQAGAAPGRGKLPHSGSSSFYDQAQQIDQALRASPKDRAAVGDRISMLAGLLGTLARRPDLTKESALQAGAEAVKRGDVSAEEVQSFLAKAPKNPNALRDFVDRNFADMLMASVHLSTARDGSGR